MRMGINISDTDNVDPYILEQFPLIQKSSKPLSIEIYHLYKPTIMQTIVVADNQRRTEFCRWYVSKYKNLNFHTVVAKTLI